jgi:hypothetical protein
VSSSYRREYGDYYLLESDVMQSDINISRMIAASNFRMKELYIEEGLMENGSTLKMEADGSSETLVTIYLPTQHPIPKHSYFLPEDKFVHNLYRRV